MDCACQTEERDHRPACVIVITNVKSCIGRCLLTVLPSRTSVTNKSLTRTIRYCNVDSTQFLQYYSLTSQIVVFIFTSVLLNNFSNTINVFRIELYKKKVCNSQITSRQNLKTCLISQCLAGNDVFLMHYWQATYKTVFALLRLFRKQRRFIFGVKWYCGCTNLCKQFLCKGVVLWDVASSQIYSEICAAFTS